MHDKKPFHSITNKFLYTIIALTPFQFEADDAVWDSDEEIASVMIPYVDANYQRLVKELEQDCGITFSSVPPYTFDAHPTIDANARYDHNYGSIIFYLAGAWDPGALAKVLTSFHITRGQFRQELEGTIRHELGHDYFLERAEAFGTKASWTEFPVDSYGYPTRQNYATRTIGEGVAEYMSGRKRDEGRIQYELVEPILSRNCKKGIDAIVQHPILPNEWDNLPLYVDRIRQLLQNSKYSH